jgi:hypothetical protein
MRKPHVKTWGVLILKAVEKLRLAASVVFSETSALLADMADQ